MNHPDVYKLSEKPQAPPAYRTAKRPALEWAYGVSTVPQRRADLLPKALASLAAAGFDKPRLFVDGCADRSLYEPLGLPLTMREPPNVRTYANWALAAWELYVRQPAAHYYALFEDDIVVCRDIRAYVERRKLPERAYFNLYAHPKYEEEAKGQIGWHRSKQRGLGAVALVFSRAGLTALLANQHFVEFVMNPRQGWRNIDGGILLAMNQAGWSEWFHYPSLALHLGKQSAIGNSPQPDCKSFPGEAFSALNCTGAINGA